MLMFTVLPSAKIVSGSVSIPDPSCADSVTFLFYYWQWGICRIWNEELSPKKSGELPALYQNPQNW